MNVSVCTRREIILPCGLKDIDYQVDPYVGCEHCCHYCYALAAAETDWSNEIQMHGHIVEQLGEELEKIPPQTIYMGYHTDPYQPCEVEYRQTRKVLELFVEKGFSASILTKSDLVVRDIDILMAMKSAAVSVSVAFNDNSTRRLFEAATMDTERRIEALRRLKQAGVRTGALVCPVIPYVTDAVELIGLLASHTDVMWVYGLAIDDCLGQNWVSVKRILNRHFPDLAESIETAVFSREDRYWTRLKENLAALKKDRQLNLNVHL